MENSQFIEYHSANSQCSQLKEKSPCYENNAHSKVQLESLLQIFLCRRKHQFNPVQLVYLAGSRVIVYGDNIGIGIIIPKFLNHAFSHDVVRQAAKGLGAYDIAYAAVD